MPRGQEKKNSPSRRRCSPSSHFPFLFLLPFPPPLFAFSLAIMVRFPLLLQCGFSRQPSRARCCCCCCCRCQREDRERSSRTEIIKRRAICFDRRLDGKSARVTRSRCFCFLSHQRLPDRLRRGPLSCIAIRGEAARELRKGRCPSAACSLLQSLANQLLLLLRRRRLLLIAEALGSAP